MEEQVVPVLRVQDAGRAVGWYERLGFRKEWEHHLRAGFPVLRRPRALRERGLRAVRRCGRHRRDVRPAGDDPEPAEAGLDPLENCAGCY